MKKIENKSDSMQVKDEKKYLLLAYGHPLLDISVNVSKDFLDYYKLKENDAILAESNHSDLIERLNLEYGKKIDLELMAGGSAQNTVRIAQWVFNSLSLKCSLFCGTVGNDEYADLLEQQLEQDNVKPVYIRIYAEKKHNLDCNLNKENQLNVNNLIRINSSSSDLQSNQLEKKINHPLNTKIRTGLCIALNTNNALCRSMVTFLGASHLFNKQHLDLKLIQKVELIYFCGFLLASSFDAVQQLIKLAFEYNKKIAFNLSACFICEKYGHQLGEVFSKAHILFGNLDEFKAFAKFHQISIEDTDQLVVELFNKFKVNLDEQIVLITDNSNFVRMYKRTDGSCTQFTVPSLDEKLVVDTIGAGDAFTGGFLAFYLLQKPLDLCVKCGIFCSRQIIRVKGCNLNKEEIFEEANLNKLFT